MSVDLNEALSGSKHMPMWLDREDRPEVAPSLSGKVETDLAIVGAGYTGLWAALCAKEAQPDLDVILVEGSTVGDGASGRNGGFVSESITHYLNDAHFRLPEGEPTMASLGRENAKGLLDTFERYNMNVEFEANGYLHVAVEAHQIKALEALHAADHRNEAVAHSIMLNQEEVQKEVASPAFVGGHWTKEGRLGILHPGRLADGLREAACGLGVRLYENTKLNKLTNQGAEKDLLLSSKDGELLAKKVLLANNCYPNLLPNTRAPLMAPVWEYALATEPLNDEQMASIGWKTRQGLSGVENFFHYYRLTQDNRIMMGGGRPAYHLNDPEPFMGPDDPTKFEAIAAYFFKIFPQLAGLKFSHRWCGPIGVARDHAMHFIKAMDDRVVCPQGFTGQGVTPTRFGARVSLALLGIGETELSKLAFVKRKPANWPPGIFRWVGSNITFSALGKQDKNQGRPGPWLRMLDRIGFGIHL